MDGMQSPNELNERLAELERMHKHVLRVNLAWRGAGLIAFIACTILVLAQVREGNRSKYLDASNLMIHDSHGRERIALNTDDSNGDISFYDGNGRRRMMIALFRDEVPPGETPGIALFDEKGEKRMMIKVDERGASISVKDASGVLHEIPFSLPSDTRLPTGQDDNQEKR
jgi:hypothetical protein